MKFDRIKEIKKTLPTVPIWQWSATDVALGIRHKAISSTEATKSVLQRIEKVNPKYNAIINLMSEKALKQAKQADELIAQGIILSPLHGVPVTIKDNVDVKGERNTNGGVFKDRVCEGDSTIATNFNTAGCVTIGMTNLPEFAIRWFSENPLFGRTLNPWDESLTPGGSSGGAASATASGMCFIAHGNDIGGSIRYPAYACGVVGLRPTWGRIPQFDPSSPGGRTFASEFFSIEGPIARNVNDIRLGLEVLSRGSIYDQVWVPAPLTYDDCRIKRIAIVTEIDGMSIEPSVKENLKKTAKWLIEDGYVVEEIKLPEFNIAAEVWGKILVAEKTTTIGHYVTDYGSKDVNQAWEGMIYGAPGAKDMREYMLAIAKRDELRRIYNEILDTYPVIMLPVSGKEPFKHGDDLKGNDYFKEVIMPAQIPLLALVCLNYPSMSVPTGLKDGHIPQGVQLFASDYRADLCLQVAEDIERHAKMPFKFD
ncbi:amidase [Helicobacter cappadocius]|uniref:Amidase n=1 Tax=Helicobacter cappadocius TaxID=3063998 RepID=A0AA90PQN7_9HELI|nr:MULTISPECIES: amidase [unclassified Helicobacter]MDO7253172.1 amidase [Helicobacter sp. faydin-H75]MDP2539096.1 amidase [Helicobacter sp. faydin-H76]